MNNSLFLPRFACKKQQSTGYTGVGSTQGKGCHIASRNRRLAITRRYDTGYTTFEGPISANIWPKTQPGLL